MGKQIGLLLTSKDLIDLERVLLAKGDVEFLSDDRRGDVSALGQPSTIVINENDYGKVSVFLLLAPRPRLGDIVLAKNSTRVDLDKSYLIDLWRPYYRDGIIRRGRLWYEHTPYVEGCNVPKSEAFQKWAERLYSRVRRNFRYNAAYYAYVGEDAATRIASGELRVSN